MRNVPILGGDRPATSFGPEWVKATCHGEDCDRTWEGHGSVESRRAVARAQKHVDRTGHQVALEWANRR